MTYAILFIPQCDSYRRKAIYSAVHQLARCVHQNISSVCITRCQPITLLVRTRNMWWCRHKLPRATIPLRTHNVCLLLVCLASHWRHLAVPTCTRCSFLSVCKVVVLGW